MPSRHDFGQHRLGEKKVVPAHHRELDTAPPRCCLQPEGRVHPSVAPSQDHDPWRSSLPGRVFLSGSTGFSDHRSLRGKF